MASEIQEIQDIQIKNIQNYHETRNAKNADINNDNEQNGDGIFDTLNLSYAGNMDFSNAIVKVTRILGK